MMEADLDAVEALRSALAPVKVGRDNYTALDRYRDFKRVLLDTPEGRRVLSQIIDNCEGRRIGDDILQNHALLAARAAQRNIGLWISATATVLPRSETEQPKGA